MSLFGQQSIQRKIERALLITGIGVLLLTTAGFTVNDYLTSRKEVLDRLCSQAAIIAANSVGAVTFQDQESAAQTLASLQHEPNIVAAALYDNEGHRIAEYQRVENHLPITVPEEGDPLLANEHYLFAPVMLGRQQVGVALLLSDLKVWHQQQFRSLLVVMGLFLISLVFAVLLARRYKTLITAPILSLADTARRISANRDYRLRAEKECEDEVGRLVDDFNQMLTEIERREDQLQMARRQLEQKVEERTAELASVNQQLKYQAHFDMLTGLANRITFESNLKAAINRVDRKGGKLITLFLDLDRFKTVNDSLGHDVGDKLLIDIAGRLDRCLRESDTLARLGGDEFAILIENEEPEVVAEVAVKLIDEVRKTSVIDGHHLRVTASVGISVYPNDGHSAADIVKHADTAMYHAKDLGRNQFSFFSASMNQKAERRLQLESKLRKALEAGSFYLSYQPKFDVQSLQLCGVEVLVRWHDPEEGEISPAEFIPLAEECGMVADIDSWVLQNACRELLSLSDDGVPPVSLSVNFSPLHFIRDNVCEEVAYALQVTGFPASYLELEITETVIGSEANNPKEQLIPIRELGVELSIDDFGKAHSSLSRLKSLPFNALKIDRAFIRDIGVDSDDEVIVKTIITMGRNLNMKVIAEGVESDQQYQFVKEHGADIVQGFLFAKPLSLDQLRAQLSASAEVYQRYTENNII